MLAKSKCQKNEYPIFYFTYTSTRALGNRVTGPVMSPDTTAQSSPLPPFSLPASPQAQPCQITCLESGRMQNGTSVFFWPASPSACEAKRAANAHLKARDVFWMCEGCASVIPGEGPVCFRRNTAADAPQQTPEAQFGSTCQEAARRGRTLAEDCFQAARLLAKLPQPPATFNLSTPWHSYRLADMFKGKDRDKLGGAALHRRNFPHSIAVEYMDREKKCCYNLQLLRNIIKKRTNASSSLSLPSPTTLVMQVRVGDVIDFDEHHSVLDMLTFNRVTAVLFELHGDSSFDQCHPPATSWDAWASRHGARHSYRCGIQYVQPLHYYLNTLNRLPREIERVVIVAGSHWPRSKDGKTHIGNRGYLQGIELRSFD